MKRIVWTFGLIAGLIIALPMAQFFFVDDLEHSLLTGYAGMVAGFLLVYFGVRRYRDTVAGGTIRFGRAFKVGALIALIASLCYVAAWEGIYFGFHPPFMESYSEHVLDGMRSAGATEAELAGKRAELAVLARRMENPFFNSAMTFLEPLPVALLAALISAGVASRRKATGDPGVVSRPAGAAG